MTIIYMVVATYYKSTDQLSADEYRNGMLMFLKLDAICIGIAIFAAVLMTGGQ